MPAIICQILYAQLNQAKFCDNISWVHGNLLSYFEIINKIRIYWNALFTIYKNFNKKNYFHDKRDCEHLIILCKEGEVL